jgi:chromosome segregation ATPase
MSMSITDLVNALSQVLEKVVAPSLGEIRGELKALNYRFDSVNSRFDSVNTQVASANSRIDALNDRLTTESTTVHNRIDALNDRLTTELKTVNTRIDALSERVDHGFRNLELLLQNAVIRGDKDTTREIAELRDRVVVLERKQLSQ